MNTEYRDYANDFISSKSKDILGIIEIALKSEFGADIIIEVAEEAEDILGVDYWVNKPNSKRIGIDVKARNLDPAAKYGYKDILVEYVGNTDSGKVGWALDKSKITDYVLYYWLTTDRWYLIDYINLRRVMQEYGDLIEATCNTVVGHTNMGGYTYHTLCYAVGQRQIEDIINLMLSDDEEDY